MLSFLQIWTNAIPQFLSVTRVPRVRILLVLIAAYATGLGLFIKMEKVASVSIARLGQQSIGGFRGGAEGGAAPLLFFTTNTRILL